MNCFNLKAHSAEGWVEFSLKDLPVPVDAKHFALLARNDSPILDMQSIRRGDPETDLYEGDVICDNDNIWLVCYERGFYVINEAYVVKHFNQLSNFKVLDTKENYPINISLKLKRRHLFRYNQTIFYMHDILGAINGKLLINLLTDPIDVDKIDQECAFTFQQHKAYLGDPVGDDVIHLEHGRLYANGVDLDKQEVANGNSL